MYYGGKKDGLMRKDEVYLGLFGQRLKLIPVFFMEVICEFLKTNNESPSNLNSATGSPSEGGCLL